MYWLLRLAVCALLFPHSLTSKWEVLDGKPSEDESKWEILANQKQILEPLKDHDQVYFEMESDHERLCGVEGRLMKEKGNLLVRCSSNSDCLPPTECHLSTGFCCLIALNQEPLPVGCPMGTRSLKYSNGTELSCNPSIPNSCPGSTMCYTDTITHDKRCCGKDPGQGCPTGSRVITTTSGDPKFCSPGSYTDGCDGNGLCQWSHLIDRYQCCQPDNGCPLHHSPIISNGSPLQCTPQSSNCGGGSTCKFNFWTANYQCCKLDVNDLCPVGNVPFLEETKAIPRSCKDNTGCPIGYHCGDNKICCGQPGKCPENYFPMKDSYGRLSACTKSITGLCSKESSCVSTSTVSQMICCTQIEYKCPVGRPFPSVRNPKTCSLSDFSSCPLSQQCMPSNINGVNICCSTSTRSQQPTVPSNINFCPIGWNLFDGKVTYCSPSSRSSQCPGYSSCMRTTNANRQFVCCIPNSSPSTMLVSTSGDRCPSISSKPEMDGTFPRQCKTNEECAVGFTCQISFLRKYSLCCSSTVSAQQPQVAFNCPQNGQNAVISQQGNNVFCNSPGQRDVCPLNALCQSSSNSAGLFICCYSATSNISPICPNSAQPQPTVGGSYASCDLAQPTCNVGFSCVRASNDFSISLCCSSTAITQPMCPNQQSVLTENGRPYYCNPSLVSSCPSGYVCNAAINTAGTYICCSSPTTTTCPANYNPSLDNLGNPIYCSITNPNGCPGGSSCMQSSANNALFLCCRSSVAPRVCPNNLNALLTPSGTLETCTGPGSPCSKNGYSCQLSTVLAQYVCCGMDTQVAVCADGRETFQQVTGTTYSCNPLQFPSGCPTGYDCSQSSILGTYVCCRSTTTTTPSSLSRCPIGWNAYRNEVSGESRTCAGPMDMSCPTGFSCTPSTSNSFVCCRLASSLRCISGAPFLLNNQPRLCSKQRLNQCPKGYSCEQSTTPSVTICCSSALSLDEQIRCPDRTIPEMLGTNIRFCPTVGSSSGCGSGSVCQMSNKGINVCCKTTRMRSSPSSPSSPDSLSVCGSLSTPFIANGRPLSCTTTNNACPISHPCLPSLSTSSSSFCCQEAQCRSGVGIGTSTRQCNNNNDCPSNSICQKAANIAGLSICCSTDVPPETRCLGRSTKLIAGKPMSCMKGSNCGKDFECSSQSTNGRSICCEMASKATNVCPDSRTPFFIANDNKILFCDDTGYMCPKSYQCKHSPSIDRFICCSDIPQCPLPLIPQLIGINKETKRCFSSDSECSPGHSCIPSTVSQLKVCCRDGGRLNDDPNTTVVKVPQVEIEKSASEGDWVVVKG